MTLLATGLGLAVCGTDEEKKARPPVSLNLKTRTQQDLMDLTGKTRKKIGGVAEIIGILGLAGAAMPKQEEVVDPFAEVQNKLFQTIHNFIAGGGIENFRQELKKLEAKYNKIYDTLPPPSEGSPYRYRSIRATAHNMLNVDFNDPEISRALIDTCREEKGAHPIPGGILGRLMNLDDVGICAAAVSQNKNLTNNDLKLILRRGDWDMQSQALHKIKDTDYVKSLLLAMSKAQGMLPVEVLFLIGKLSQEDPSFAQAMSQSPNWYVQKALEESLNIDE